MPGRYQALSPREANFMPAAAIGGLFHRMDGAFLT